MGWAGNITHDIGIIVHMDGMIPGKVLAEKVNESQRSAQEFTAPFYSPPIFQSILKPLISKAPAVGIEPTT
jgi:hypothetical protein